MEISKIEELIEAVEEEFRHFERPSASNSKRLLEVVKAYVASASPNKEVTNVCACGPFQEVAPGGPFAHCDRCGLKI